MYEIVSVDFYGRYSPLADGEFVRVHGLFRGQTMKVTVHWTNEGPVVHPETPNVTAPNGAILPRQATVGEETFAALVARFAEMLAYI